MITVTATVTRIARTMVRCPIICIRTETIYTRIASARISICEHIESIIISNEQCELDACVLIIDVTVRNSCASEHASLSLYIFL